MNIIVAFTTKTFGIGKNGTIPWNIPEDLRHFYDLTKDSTVVMGYRTWLSLPEDKRPLKNRRNIVVVGNPSMFVSNNDLVFCGINELDSLISSFKNVWIIGGSLLYKKYVGVAQRIYATLIEKEFDCDTVFPTDRFHEYHVDSYSSDYYSDAEKCKFRYVTYVKSTETHEEFQYLSMLRNIISNGNTRPDRTGVGTVSVFAPNSIRFNISKSFPLVTTKFVGIKMIVKELLWFLRGQTDSKILEAQGVNIWRDNSTREFLDKRGLSHLREGDIGEMYGICLRSYGCDYQGCDHDYLGKGFDQITNLIQGLKEDPFSRRHILTTYNPGRVHNCALYPCHGVAIMFYVTEKSGKLCLSCHMVQRSADTVLGLPTNIASYALLTHIIAKKTDMQPDELIISFGDAHVYRNHFDQVKCQIERSPLPYPVVEVSDSVKDKDFKDINVDDFTLCCYLYHPKIAAPMAI